MVTRTTLLLFLFFVIDTGYGVTIYGQVPLGQTNTAYRPSPTTLAAYNDTPLVPPAIPSPPPPRQFTLALQHNAQDVNGLSIPHTTGMSFFGFSIELSVVNQILGKNSSLIFPTFLNLISNIVARSGGIPIRIGGNTQESAAMVDHIPGAHVTSGRVFGKQAADSNATTKTPAVVYTRDMFYICSNISSLLNVKWFFGIPFNDSVNWRLAIAEESQNILGDNLLALQAGNEPDFYVDFGRRKAPYTPQDYSNEVANLITAIDNNPRLPVKNKLIGPSVASGPWTPEQVWDTGFMERFKDRVYAFAVEHYPDNNCAAQFNTGFPITLPQTVLPAYLQHTARVTQLVAPYLNSSRLAQSYNKPFIMFETNTASCGGFAGVSDSYGASLWAIDYGLQLAYSNFTHALLHLGGQNVFYNAFISPPTNQSAYNQWTVGAVYYSVIVLAEALGTTNTSRIVDLNANAGNTFTPAYAIYENGRLSKVAVINYVDDQTGASSLSVTITVQGGTITTTGVSGSVKVKYLESPSVVTRDNIKWAGQTMGNTFHADGRFRGTLNVTSIPCTNNNNVCTVPVPSPGFALIFMDDDDDDDALGLGQASQTYATTRRTNVHNTATAGWSDVDGNDGIGKSNGGSGKVREEWGGLKSSNYGMLASSGGGELRWSGGTAGLVVLGVFWTWLINFVS